MRVPIAAKNKIVFVNGVGGKDDGPSISTECSYESIDGLYDGQCVGGYLQALLRIKIVLDHIDNQNCWMIPWCCHKYPCVSNGFVRTI